MSSNTFAHSAPSAPALAACPSWCAIAATGSHTNMDESCFSHGMDLPLPSEESDQFGEPHTASVYVQQSASLPQVVIDKDCAPALQMTIEEARGLLAALTGAIFLAES